MSKSSCSLPCYSIASLVWCRWAHMKWPAMITYDPHQAIYYKTHGRSVTHYHVQYFGIRAQRGWVRAVDVSQLLPGEEKVPQHQVKKTLQRDYDAAIKEVSKAVKVGPRQRKLRFIFNYSHQVDKKVKQEHTKGRRSITTTQTARTDDIVSRALIREESTSESCSSSPRHPSDHRTGARVSLLSLPSPAMLTPPSTGSDTDSADSDHCSIATASLPDSRLPTTSTSNVPTSLCDICACHCEGSEMVACNAQCLRVFHIDCLGLASKPKFAFVCDECILAQSSCGLCGSADGELVSCSHARCDKQYHLTCAIPNRLFQVNSTDRTLVCALHQCARCLAGETLTHQKKKSSKLVQCIRCPFALHKSTCLIAGCEMIDDTHMLCYQHLAINSSSSKSLHHINMNSCLECNNIGTLVCCEVCPATYHAKCLPENKRPTEGENKWICPSCVNHELPTYGSVVLCKCGKYRWWPARIVPQDDVPDSMLPSRPAKGMFLAQFYGTQQYTWTSHGRVIAFTDDGEWMEEMVRRSRHGSRQSAEQVAVFRMACEEALIAFKDQRSREQQARSLSMDSKIYCPIKRNKYLVPRPPVVKETEPCLCTVEDPCSSSSSCINRELFIECNPSCCPVRDACQNQRISKQQSATTYPFHTTTRGWGLKSRHDITEGDFVIEYIGEVLDKTMCQQRLKESQERSITNFYLLTLKGNLVIDASNKSNHARFINHSCDPNCATEKWTVRGETRIGIFAIKDIPADTELTFDYQLDCLGNEKKKCLCGAKNCSGFIGEKPRMQDQSPPHQVKVVKPKRKRRNSTRARRTKLAKPDYLDTGHEDNCFICKDGGDLLLCDFDECLKVYHPACLRMSDVPDDTFICPRHVCNDCSSPAVEYCTNCPSSYCSIHLIDRLQDCLCANCSTSDS